MAAEQQNPSTVGGCKLTKKLKQNKVPQRGLGVAQLEKIILEEQRLKDAAAGVKFRRHPLISKSDVANPDFVRNNSSARVYNFGEENQNRQNRYLITMPANPSIWAQFHQPSSSSMVSVSLGTTLSSSSTSVMNIQIEPPSIQSLCGNNYPSLQPDGGDKMVVGMKRSYPFSMENIVPIPSFNSNISPISKPDESTAASLQFNTLFCRETPSSLGSIRDQKTKKFIQEKPDLAKDFLTLAPPQPSSYQGQTRDLEWSKQQPLHSFFPAAKIHGISNGEVGEHVDLSLKL